MRKLFQALSLAVFLVSVAAAQSRMTIPEAAARVSPGPLVKTRIAEIAAINVPVLIDEADLILVGTLERNRVYLTPDQMELYTEFRATPVDVVAQRRANRAESPESNPILVRQWGGETTINGVEVKAIDSNIPPLPVGVPV